MISKRWLKIRLGRTAELFRPDLARAVAAAEPQAMASRLGQCVSAAQMHRAASTGDWGGLRSKLAGYWRGAEGDQFYSAYPERYDAWFLGPHYPVVDAMVSAAETGEFSRLIEIGCGDGRVLQHVAGRLPSLERVTGLDINTGIIARNGAAYVDDARLSFEAADGHPWLLRASLPGSIVMAYGGVFEYFTHDDLTAVFGHLAAQLAPSMLVLTEPVADDFDVATEIHSRPHGIEFSFSHPYRRLLEAAGFTVVFEQETRIDHRWIMIVARTPGTR